MSRKFTPRHQNEVDKIIRSAFSDHVRKERRGLLLASSISLFLALGKISPSEVDTLGLKVTNLSPRFIYLALMLLTSYLLIVFKLHVDPEFRAASEEMKGSVEILREFDTREVRELVISSPSTWFRYALWITVDYWFPLFLGLLSILSLTYRLIY